MGGVSAKADRRRWHGRLALVLVNVIVGFVAAVVLVVATVAAKLLWCR